VALAGKIQPLRLRQAAARVLREPLARCQAAVVAAADVQPQERLGPVVRAAQERNTQSRRAARLDSAAVVEQAAARHQPAQAARVVRAGFMAQAGAAAVAVRPRAMVVRARRARSSSPTSR
jgi:hypothetical protein